MFEIEGFPPSASLRLAHPSVLSLPLRSYGNPMAMLASERYLKLAEAYGLTPTGELSLLSPPPHLC